MSKKRYRQAGYSSISLLAATVITGAAILGVLNASKKIADANKNKQKISATSAGKTRNEAAIQYVSQLINTGILWHNGTNTGGKVEPSMWTLTSGPRWKYENSNPAVVKVIVCQKNIVATTAQKAEVIAINSATSGATAPCSANETALAVKVSFNSYEAATEINPDAVAGMVSAESLNGNDTSGNAALLQKSSARIIVKLTQDKNKGLAKNLDAYVSDTDYCFYMRPNDISGSSEAIKYDANGSIIRSANLLMDIEPRAEGTGSGRYKKTTLNGSTIFKPGTAPERLPAVRKMIYEQSKIVDEANKIYGYRNFSYGAIELTNTTDYFIGVQPQEGANGPQFQYYLSANESTYTTTLIHTPKETWPIPSGTTASAGSTAIKQLEYGCITSVMQPSVASGGPSFCTRVDLPYKQYSLTADYKCVQHKQTLTATSQTNTNCINLAHGKKNCVTQTTWTKPTLTLPRNPIDVQVLCNPTWPTQVTTMVGKVEINSPSYSFNGQDIYLLPNADAVKSEVMLDEYTNLMNMNPTLFASKHTSGQGFYDFGVNKVIEAITDTGATVSATQVIYTANAPADTAVTTIITPAPTPSGTVTPTPTPTPTPSGTATPSPAPTSMDTEVTYYTLDQIPAVSSDSYNSKRCVYYKYYNPTNPTSCSISMETPLGSALVAGEYVCRTGDGCFDSSTKIKMADGSEKQISEIKAGELVYNPKTQKSAEVITVTSGPEQDAMYHVGFADRIVNVTKTHPFFTDHGWVQAKDLLRGQQILDTGNIYRTLEIVEKYMPETLPLAFNIVVKGESGALEEHFLLANGVVTGDLFVQQELEAKRK